MELLVQMGVDLLRVLIGIVTALVFSAGALYTGMSLLDKLTAGIDEWKEIKKGNAAVGLLFAAVMVCMVLIIGPRISELVYAIQADALENGTVPQLIALFVFLLMNYLAGLLIAVLVIYLTINLIDRITPDLQELAELKKGNLAVALMFSTALVLIVLLSSASIESIFTMVKSLETLAIKYVGSF